MTRVNERALRASFQHMEPGKPIRLWLSFGRDERPVEVEVLSIVHEHAHAAQPIEVQEVDTKIIRHVKAENLFTDRPETPSERRAREKAEALKTLEEQGFDLILGDGRANLVIDFLTEQSWGGAGVLFQTAEYTQTVGDEVKLNYEQVERLRDRLTTWLTENRNTKKENA